MSRNIFFGSSSRRYRALCAALCMACSTFSFAGIVQKEGTGIEEKTVLFSSPSQDKPSFPKMEGWLKNYDEAVQASRESGKPLLIAFLGSDWCPWSLRFALDVLSTAEFKKEVKNEMVLLWLDYPEEETASLLKEKNNKVKELFHVFELPTLVLVDASGEEISKMGYTPMHPKEFAASLKQSAEGYVELKLKLEQGDLAAMSGVLLKELYLKARSLGCNQFKDKILDAGVKAEHDSFFLLEKYTRFVESGKRKDRQAVALREKIEDLDPKNALGTHLQLAILDFQSNANRRKTSSNPKAVVKPLVEYVQKFGKKDADNVWRVEMMIAQYLFSKNKTADALKHAEASFEAAPVDAKPEIAQSVEYLKTHLPQKGP